MPRYLCSKWTSRGNFGRMEIYVTGKNGLGDKSWFDVNNRNLWPKFTVTVTCIMFFLKQSLLLLPMVLPDLHQKCSYTWKCCQPLPSLQSLDQWPFFERCKANRTGQVPRLISSKSPAIDVALEIFASERENRFATKFGGVGGSSAPWYSSAPVVFVCSSALECSKQQQGKCCSSPRYSLAPKKRTTRCKKATKLQNKSGANFEAPKWSNLWERQSF